MVSLQEAVDEYRSQRDSRAFGTGCTMLDALIMAERGRIVEISGPPGSGKTTVGLSVAADALSRGHGVLWVSTQARTLPLMRLHELLDARPKQGPRDLAHLLFEFDARSASQLVALFRDHAHLIPASVHVIIVDGMGPLMSREFKDKDDQPARRARVVDVVLASLDSLCARRAICGLVTCNLVSQRTLGLTRRLQSELGGGVWAARFKTRVVLARDIVAQRLATSWAGASTGASAIYATFYQDEEEEGFGPALAITAGGFVLAELDERSNDNAAPTWTSTISNAPTCPVSESRIDGSGSVNAVSASMSFGASFESSLAEPHTSSPSIPDSQELPPLH